MGKASRRKQLDEQRQQFFATHGDGRSAEDRANARAMLDALQAKLDDDALREDGTLRSIHPYELVLTCAAFDQQGSTLSTASMRTRDALDSRQA
jgi:hypothetical protein